MLVFKDFAQKLMIEPKWFDSGKLEPIEDTLLRLNNWRDETKAKVLNIETIWMPYRKTQDLDTPIVYRMVDGEKITSLQIIRVWYEKD